MNLRKALFIFGGGGLIVLILSFRFGLWKKIAVPEKKQSSGTVRQVSPESGKMRRASTNKMKTEQHPAEEKKSIPTSLAPAELPAEKKKPVHSSGEQIANTEQTVAVTVPLPSAKEAAVHPLPKEKPDPLGSGDPFSYSISGADDFSPLNSGVQVGQISIKGIIQYENQEPIALLQLNDTGRSYYVKKGNVIRIHTKSKSGNLVTEAYIVVRNIRDDEVELIQQERPDKVIFVR